MQHLQIHVLEEQSLEFLVHCLPMITPLNVEHG